MEGNFWIRKGGLVKCLQLSMSDSPWESGNWRGGAFFRCHNKGAPIAICEESGIESFPLHAWQSYATKTCPTPNANSHFISAKSLRAQNVLLPKSPMKASLWTIIRWICRYVFSSGRAGPREGCEVDLAVLAILLTPPVGSLILLSILAFIHSSNIPTISWGLSTTFSLWSTKMFPASSKKILAKQITLRY